MTETDLWWVFKVWCYKCGWKGYSDQCMKGGDKLTLLCPTCLAPILPVWRSGCGEQAQ